MPVLSVDCNASLLIAFWGRRWGKTNERVIERRTPIVRQSISLLFFLQLSQLQSLFPRLLFYFFAADKRVANSRSSYHFILPFFYYQQTAPTFLLQCTIHSAIHSLICASFCAYKKVKGFTFAIFFHVFIFFSLVFVFSRSFDVQTFLLSSRFAGHQLTTSTKQHRAVCFTWLLYLHMCISAADCCRYCCCHHCRRRSISPAEETGALLPHSHFPSFLLVLNYSAHTQHRHSFLCAVLFSFCSNTVGTLASATARAPVFVSLWAGSVLVLVARWNSTTAKSWWTHCRSVCGVSVFTFFTSRVFLLIQSRHHSASSACLVRILFFLLYCRRDQAAFLCTYLAISVFSLMPLRGKAANQSRSSRFGLVIIKSTKKHTLKICRTWLFLHGNVKHFSIFCRRRRRRFSGETEKRTN